MSHKTGQSDETCHFGGGAALFSIALVAASQRSTNGPQLARRSLPELEAAACGGKGLLKRFMSSHSKVTPILNGYDRAKREANEDERKREKRGASTNRTYHLTPQGPKSERERGWSSHGSQATAQSQGRAAANAGLRRPLGVDPPFKPLGVEADAPMRLCV
ncbi:unnamed protein product [Fusarium graminearum]|uniref:Chromosome 1, complete genome n=1 Tax=Gibberella zeae (strain ATCC MYA-4620 / CBS 123657 / FGSC 9075 / NRRL 31084 / PH-1) TaxID=229533 RepID=A0A098DA37_GIBZE|nr:unnamed protein product [Fusarium graminearum]